MNVDAKTKFLINCFQSNESSVIPRSALNATGQVAQIFFRQSACLMPDDVQDQEVFCWSLIYCLEPLFGGDTTLLPSRSKTLRTIALTKKAIKAIQQAKEIAGDSMILPILDFSKIEEFKPYTGYFENAEASLQVSLRILERFRECGYSDSWPKDSQSMALWLLRGFFEKHLEGRSLKIQPVRKGIFEKENSKNLYEATSIKLTTNAANAVGIPLTEDVIRKRLKKFGPPLVFPKGFPIPSISSHL